MADVNANIGINIDTSQSLAEIKALQRQLAQLYTSINKGSAAAAAAQKGLATNLMNTINAGGKFYAQMGTIRTSTESFTHALEKNKLTMREYFRFAGGSTRTFGKLFKSEFDTIGKVAEERVKKMQTQYIKLGRDASGAMKAISITPTTLNMKDYGNQVAVAAQKQALLNQLLKQGSTNLLNFGKNTQWAGRQLMVGFTVPLTYFGTAAAKTFMDLEAQALKFKRVYGDMFTTTAQTDKALQDVQALAKEFTKYGVAVTKTMEMAANAAAMGKTGAELTAQVAEATRLAVLGNVEQQQALDTTISLTNAFGLEADQLAQKINFLNSVENQTVTSIEDLTIAIPKAGPVIQQLGGSVEDLAFFLTAMREGGINASESANALKSGLASLINPTKKASQMLADMGINIKDIVERNKGDLKATVVEFAQALDTLAPLERARAIEQLFGKFQFARLSTLFQNVTKDGTQASKVLKMAGASVEELAILSERELKTVEDAVGTNFREAVEQLKLTIAPIGKEFLKTITPVIKFFGTLLEKFNGLSDGSKKFIVVLTTLIGLVGPTLLMTFGLLANGAANIIKMFILMRQGFLKLSGNTTNLAQQTQYMTTEQQEAAIVAASLNQAHTRLTQQFILEAGAVTQLRNAYVQATTAALRFAAANPGMMMPGFKPGIKGGGTAKFASGTSEVVGGQPGKDSVPSLLTPGEAVIPAGIAQDDRFKPIIAALVSGEIAKYQEGTNEVTFGGKSYNAKSAKGAKDIRNFLNSLQKNPDGSYNYVDPEGKYSRNNIPAARIAEVLQGRADSNKFALNEIKEKLYLNKEGVDKQKGLTSAKDVKIKELRDIGAKAYVKETQFLENEIKKAGIALTRSQVAELNSTVAAHLNPLLTKDVATGEKIWDPRNLMADKQFVNNYVQGLTRDSNLSTLLKLNDQEFSSALGIDPKDAKEYRTTLEGIKSGRHPTKPMQAKALAAYANYDFASTKKPYAFLTSKAMEYRLSEGFYGSRQMPFLEKIRKEQVAAGKYKKTTKWDKAELRNVGGKILAFKGERIIDRAGRVIGSITGQNTKAKAQNQRPTSGATKDNRIYNLKPGQGVMPPRFAGIKGAGLRYLPGADDGIFPSTPGAGIKTGAVSPGMRRQQSQMDDLTGAIKENTQSQNDGTETQEKTTKQLRQERMEKVSRVAGPTAMAAGTAAMAAGMAGADPKITNGLFAISAIAGLLPLLTNPLGIAVAAAAAFGIAIWKMTSNLNKAKEEGIALAKSMTMTNQKLVELSKITGTVSATEAAKLKRQNILTGASGVQRKTGQNILESQFGQNLVKDIEKQQKTGATNEQVAKSIGTGLSTAIMQGVLTTEQARSLAAALGEKLGNYDIPAKISGTIVNLVGPNGERLENQPLQVALEIKKQSMEQQAKMFQNAISQRKSNTGQNMMGAAAGALIGGGLVTANPVAIAGGAALGAAAIIQGNKIKAENLKLDTAAIQLGFEAVAQGQGLVDSLNKQYDNKIKQAKTDKEIGQLEAERKAAIDAVNAENAKTLDLLIKQKDQFTPGAFDAAIKAAADTMYKEGPMAVFKDQAIESLKGLENSKFKTTLQLGLASGDMDPNQIISLINMAKDNPEIKTNINAIIETQGLAEANVLIGLLERSGANQQTYEIITKFVKENPQQFKDIQDAVSQLSNILPKYGVTVDINTVGLKQLQQINRITSILKNEKGPITQEIIAKYAKDPNNPDQAVFQGILDTWQTLVGSDKTITKEMIIDFGATYSDPNVKNFFDASKGLSNVPEHIKDLAGGTAAQSSAYLVGKGTGSQSQTNKKTTTTTTDTTKERDTTLDELLKRLKFIRKASINAEGGINQLMKITGGKGLTKFGGVIQQLVEGPKGGFNREFISFLESMDNKTRKTYMTVKDGQVILTKQGKALKEAFNEKVIGEYQVAQVQAKQDTIAQGAALAKLQSAGVDTATALEMVADANLAVAINSKDISSTELVNMANRAKEAKDAVEQLNLALKQQSIDSDKQLADSKTTLDVLTKIRQIQPNVSQEIMDYIASNPAFAKSLADAFKGASNNLTEIQNIINNIPEQKKINIQVALQQNPIAELERQLGGIGEKMSQYFSAKRNIISKPFLDQIAPIDKRISGLNRQIIGAEINLNNAKKALQPFETQIAGIESEIAKKRLDIETGIEQEIKAQSNKVENIRKQIENQFDKTISNLEDAVKSRQRDIELRFDRPLEVLQEQSSDLSNELTLMDRVVDGINKKYDAQAEALNKVSEINAEIANQQKQQLGLAEALSSGDIAAAARAAEEMRASSAEAAAGRAGGVLEAARQAEIDAVRSQSGLTRLQIEEKQFQISQQMFALEEQKEAASLAIRDIEDQIYNLQEARAAMVKNVLVPEEEKLAKLENDRALKLEEIEKLELDILKIKQSPEYKKAIADVEAAEKALDALQQQLRDAELEKSKIEAAMAAALEDLDKQQKNWEDIQTGIDNAKGSMVNYNAELDKAKKIAKDLQDYILGIGDSDAAFTLPKTNPIVGQQTPGLDEYGLDPKDPDYMEKRRARQGFNSATPVGTAAGTTGNKVTLAKQLADATKLVADSTQKVKDLEAEIQKLKSLSLTDTGKVKDIQTEIYNLEAKRALEVEKIKTYIQDILPILIQEKDLSILLNDNFAKTSISTNQILEYVNNIVKVLPTKLSLWTQIKAAIDGAVTSIQSYVSGLQSALSTAQAILSTILSLNRTVTTTHIIQTIYQSSGQTGPTGPTGPTTPNTPTTPTTPNLNNPIFSQAVMYGGKIRPMSYGGRVGSDFVPALLTPGEFIVNRSAATSFAPFLNAINDSKYPSLLAKKITEPQYTQGLVSQSFTQPIYNVSSPTLVSTPVQSSVNSVNDNSSTVYNYSVGITVGGTNASADSIAKAVLNEIKYIDSQRIRGQRS